MEMESGNDVSVMLRASECRGACSCLPFFFGGVFVVLVVEVAFVCHLLSRFLLARTGRHSSSTSSSLAYESEPGSSSFSLEGNLWVAPLPEGDLSKAVLLKPGKDKKKEKDKDKDKDKVAEKDGSKEKKKEKDKDKGKVAERDGSKEGSKRGESTTGLLEIAPVWRHVVLKKGDLLLKAADGTEEHISLEGCDVVAVSSGSTAGGKWAKRFPIKLQHPTRTLYRGCKGCLFYAESGYEKEAWCEVLRATAKANDWCTRLKKEFREYTDGAETHVPYVTSFHSTREASHFVAARKEEKSDNHKNSEENVSKKRLIWNKLWPRNNKAKENTKSANAEEEFGNFSRRLSSHSPVQDEGSSNRGNESAISDDHEDSKSASLASHASNESISRSELASSDSDAEKSTPPTTTQKDDNKADKVLGAVVMHYHGNERAEKDIDQGLLCFNMLVGRLFFDFYHSETRVAWVQNHFQRLISRIKTPSYIKSITIKELDLGKDPPFATALRMLPADAAGALAMEVDMEWYGGGFITIETRIDVRDQIAQEKVASQMAKPGTAGAAAAAIVSGIGEDIDSAGLSSRDMLEARQAAAIRKTGSGDDSSIKGRWMNSVKTMMSRVADQVSQVPLMLKIRLVSVKGTCIVSLRAPPSDRMWFSFKEMPNIDLEPEPCIGDHRISSGPLGSFIASQIKVQVRESIVLPLWQDLSLHWMMAEKDDWISQSAVPVAFSAVPNPENERQSSKHNLDAQPKPVEENDRSAQSLSSRNELDKPQTLQNMESSHSLRHGSTSLIEPQTQSSPRGASNTQMQPPAVSHSLSTSEDDSGTSKSQSQFSASSEQLSSEHSVSTRPLGASLHSSAPPSIREENESDLTEGSLDNTDSKETSFGLRNEFDTSGSDRAAGRPFDTDLVQQSESSSLERESQNPSNQVSNQEPRSKSDRSKESDSKPSPRTKIFSFGKQTLEGGKKKMGSALEEGRRIVLERMNREKKEGSEGGSSRHPGSGN